MKTFVPFQKTFFQISLSVAVLFSATETYSQVIPELIFQNPVLVSGTAGQDGAKYRFYNVGPNLDAVVEIRGRSGSSVVLSHIDTAGIGWDKSFQPVLGIAGTAPANTTWSMDFRMTFYQAGTNNKKRITKFYATGLDIDGDAGTLHEFAKMKKAKSLSVCTVTS